MNIHDVGPRDSEEHNSEKARARKTAESHAREFIETEISPRLERAAKRLEELGHPSEFLKSHTQAEGFDYRIGTADRLHILAFKGSAELNEVMNYTPKVEARINSEPDHEITSSQQAELMINQFIDKVRGAR